MDVQNTYFDHASSVVAVDSLVDPVFLAMSRYRRRQFDKCAEICTEILNQNPRDQVSTESRLKLVLNLLLQAVWFLKCRALTEKEWIDDTDIEEEGVAEVLLDENAVAQAPR